MGAAARYARTIGENLKRLRVQRKCSQREIADLLGVSFQQIQKYEKGQNRLPADRIFILKIFYAVPYAEFFRLSEEGHGKRHDSLENANEKLHKIRSILDGE
jgi:transcriptional regulator with XRE-family HTH domain